MAQAQEQLLTMVAIAEGAARNAGAFLINNLGKAHVTAQKSTKDDLLDADLTAERLILQYLREQAPQYGILSEEAGREEKNLLDFWVVDPIDGSANYQHGSPLFAITIGLIIANKTRAGIIFVPMRDEMFVVIEGEGALLNNQPIKVSATKLLNDAIVHVGDFAKNGDAIANKEQTKEIGKLADHVRRVRMIGTAATDLAYIACGRADALINHAAQPWDVEVGKLLIKEAGGEVSTISQRNKMQLNIYSNSLIHDELKNLLRSKRKVFD